VIQSAERGLLSVTRPPRFRPSKKGRRKAEGGIEWGTLAKEKTA